MASDKVLLLETLEELAREELKRFQWFLTHDMVNGFHPIPRSKLENANRMDTVDCMVQTYNTDGALRITMEILRKMNLNLLAVNLYASSKHRPDKEGAAVAVVLDDKQDESHKQDVEKKVLQLLKECQPEDALKIIKKVQRELNLHEVRKYVVSSKPRGICLILNNVEFKNVKHKDRSGSDIDAETLARVFSWLGFWVVMCQDKTKEEMEQVLKIITKLGQLSELQQYGAKEWTGERRKFSDLDGLIQHGDVFVCCVLSHGQKRGIYGTDGEVLQINDLLLPFNCPALEEKPKLFFIQACRDDPEQSQWSHEAARLEQLSSENKKVEMGIAKIQEVKKRKQEAATQQYQQDSVEEANPGTLYSINHDSDFLVAMATIDKRAAYRDPKKGSLFIQSLCLQLTQGCPRGDDIVTILTGVNFDVSCNKDKIPQMPEVKSRLRKALVLPVPV